jgi:hypothetical protein
MAVVPFPGSLSSAVAVALADDDIEPLCKDHLRSLAAAGTPVDERATALQQLMEHLTTQQGSGAEWKLVPALVSIAADREGAEQTAILVCAAHLEIGRLVLGDGDDHVVPPALQEAQRVALRIASGPLSEPIGDDDALRPLLVVIAAFNGLPDLAMTLLDLDEDDFDEDDGVDDDDDEGEDDDDGR